MSDWRQNLPHILALALLLFGLLLVLTRVGLVGCSTFGTSYCDLYYGIFGKPRILLVYDPDGPGMGDPQKLAKYLEDVKRLNVREVTVDQLSAGMLDQYDVVIVERARNIPSEKLKLFYDYVINGMGRLVWIGDSGTVIGNRDTICRTLEYEVKWRTDQGTKESSGEKDVCVGVDDLSLPSNFSAAEFAMASKSALYQKAWNELAELCKDAFGGELSPVKYPEGYLCQNTVEGYYSVYFNWVNEKDFDELVNPWDRGEFQCIGQQETQKGMRFGRDILGVTFVSDAYAVSKYAEFAKQVAQLRTEFQEAHSALVKCAQSYSTCDQNQYLAQLEYAKEDLSDEINSVRSKLSGDISTLSAIQQQKELANETTQALRIAGIINVLEDGRQGLSENSSLDFLDEARNLLLEAKGYETDTVIKDQLAEIADHLAQYKQEIETKKLAVSDAELALKQCVPKDFIEEYSSKSGVPEEVLNSLISFSNQPSDEDLLDFMNKVHSGYYEDYIGKLKVDSFCNASKYFAQAIELAESMENPAESNTALAVLKIEDDEHPLVKGISQSITLEDKYGNPVPFVLVATGNQYTRVVASIEITPEYKGERLWPAITVRDPKYGSHIFGRGVVVYYAFPPETSDVLVSNLVKFILY